MSSTCTKFVGDKIGYGKDLCNFTLFPIPLTKFSVSSFYSFTFYTTIIILLCTAHFLSYVMRKTVGNLVCQVYT